MSSNATTTNNNVANLPSTPKAQIAKEVIAANVQLPERCRVRGLVD